MMWLKLFNGILVDLSEKGQGSVSVWKNFCPFLCSVWLCGLVAKSFPTLFDSMAHQAPLSMGFPRQEYWSGMPLPPPGVLPDPGIEPESPVSPSLAGGFFKAELGSPGTGESVMESSRPALA